MKKNERKKAAEKKKPAHLLKKLSPKEREVLEIFGKQVKRTNAKPIVTAYKTKVHTGLHNEQTSR